ncbi:unnamed protein product [Chrysoparadoxa australica]
MVTRPEGGTATHTISSPRRLNLQFRVKGEQSPPRDPYSAFPRATPLSSSDPSCASLGHFVDTHHVGLMEELQTSSESAHVHAAAVQDDYGDSDWFAVDEDGVESDGEDYKTSKTKKLEAAKKAYMDAVLNYKELSTATVGRVRQEGAEEGAEGQEESQDKPDTDERAASSGCSAEGENTGSDGDSAGDSSGDEDEVITEPGEDVCTTPRQSLKQKQKQKKKHRHHKFKCQDATILRKAFTGLAMTGTRRVEREDSLAEKLLLETEEDLDDEQLPKHYSSQQMFQVFRQMESGGRGAPVTALGEYVRSCQEQGLAPLPIFDRLTSAAEIAKPEAKLQKALQRVTTVAKVGHTLAKMGSASAGAGAAARASEQCYSLNLARYGLGQQRAESLAAFFRLCSIRLCRLDLAHNGIPDRSLCSILQGLLPQSHLVSLDVSGNTVQSTGTAEVLAELIGNGNGRLTALHLQSCRAGTAMLNCLVPKLGLGSLKVLCLARNNLGDDMAALAAVIADQCSLVELDLSYNHIKGEQAALLVEALGQNGRLRVVRLAYNGFGGEKVYRKLSVALQVNHKIEELDISYNGVGCAATLALMAAMMDNSTLKKLNLNGNALGKGGGEAVFQTLAHGNRPSSGLSFEISIVDCIINDRGAEEQRGMKGQLFDPRAPNGYYKLDLSVPYDRMQAKQLAQLACMQSGECWRGEKLNGVLFDFSEEEGWELPSSGILELTFLSTRPLQAQPISTQRFDDMLAQLSIHINEQGDEQAGVIIVSSMLKNLSLTTEQSIALLGMFSFSGARIEVSCLLYKHSCNTERGLQILACLNQLEAIKAEVALGNYYDQYSSSNPTGHYCLLLSKPNDRLVAIRLAEIAAVEKKAAKLAGKTDTSQKGDWEGFRNCRYEQAPIAFSPSWELPEHGTLEMDYVSPLHPGLLNSHQVMGDKDFSEFLAQHVTIDKSAELATDAEILAIFQQIDVDGNKSVEADELSDALTGFKYPPTLKEVKEMISSVDQDGNQELDFDEFKTLWRHILSKIRLNDRIHKLRVLSRTVFLTAKQLGSIIYRLPDPQDRVLVVCSFFRRITDWHNLHICWAQLLEHELQMVMDRLGALNILNPFHPEGQYSLNFRDKDSRAAAQCIVKLATGAEAAGQDINSLFMESCFGEKELPSFPKEWNRKLPSDGTWTFQMAAAEWPLDLCFTAASTTLLWELGDSKESQWEGPAKVLQVKEQDLDIIMKELNGDQGS